MITSVYPKIFREETDCMHYLCKGVWKGSSPAED